MKNLVLCAFISPWSYCSTLMDWKCQGKYGIWSNHCLESRMSGEGTFCRISWFLLNPTALKPSNNSSPSSSLRSCSARSVQLTRRMSNWWYRFLESLAMNVLYLCPPSTLVDWQPKTSEFPNLMHLVNASFKIKISRSIWQHQKPPNIYLFWMGRQRMHKILEDWREMTKIILDLSQRRSLIH